MDISDGWMDSCSRTFTVTHEEPQKTGFVTITIKTLFIGVAVTDSVSLSRFTYSHFLHYITLSEISHSH